MSSPEIGGPPPHPTEFARSPSTYTHRWIPKPSNLVTRHLIRFANRLVGALCICCGLHPPTLPCDHNGETLRRRLTLDTIPAACTLLLAHSPEATAGPAQGHGNDGTSIPLCGKQSNLAFAEIGSCSPLSLVLSLSLSVAGYGHVRATRASARGRVKNVQRRRQPNPGPTTRSCTAQ